MTTGIDPILPEARIRAMKAAGYWHDRLLIDDLDQAVARTPDRIALIDHNSMTGAAHRAELCRACPPCGRIAAGLARLGVARGDVVSYQLPNWWQFTALHLACCDSARSAIRSCRSSANANWVSC